MACSYLPLNSNFGFSDSLTRIEPIQVNKKSFDTCVEWLTFIAAQSVYFILTCLLITKYRYRYGIEIEKVISKHH